MIPEQQLAELRIQRSNDEITHSDYYAKLESLYAAAPSEQRSQPANPQAAAEQITALRAARLDGSITAQQFFERMEALHANESAPISDGQKLANDVMAAPADPNAYRLDYGPDVEWTPEQTAFDAEVRSAFHSAQIPQHLAASIFSGVDRVANELADAPVEELQARVANTEQTLRSIWGREFDGRIDAIDSLLEQMSAKHPTIAKLINEQPYLFAHPNIISDLDAVARYRSGQFI